LSPVEYRKTTKDLYHIIFQVEDLKGKALHRTRALVDTGSTKCKIPREDNKKFFHLKEAGCDGMVDTAAGLAKFDWVVIPRIVLMRNVKVKLGDTRFLYELEKTDLYLENVQAWLGDDYVIGMNFIDNFDVRMTKDRRIIFKK
jgi:predicted aspartyl protease